MPLTLTDPTGALGVLRTALVTALGEYGFEVASIGPVVPLGRAAAAPERLPPLSEAAVTTPIELRALHWRLPGAPASGAAGSADLSPRAAVAEVADREIRERALLDAELLGRLARRPKPAAPRAQMPRPARRLTAALDTDDDAPDSDNESNADFNQGNDDDSDHTTD